MEVPTRGVGLRSRFHAGYYAVSVFEPAGSRFEAVVHGQAGR